MSAKTKAKRDKRKRLKTRKDNAHLLALRAQDRLLSCSRKVYLRMTEDHPDVLQNIEFALVSAWHRDATIDDYAVKQALIACIREVPVREIDSMLVQQMLDDVRTLRDDVADELWRDGLRVILGSVNNHSSAAPGEREYLCFAEQFV